MSSFSISTVEPLDYDFTGYPSNSKKGGYCKGKGLIPEPSKQMLASYQQAVRELFQVKDNAGVEQAMDEQTALAKGDELLELTAALCQNSPSADELRDLPPRIKNAFFKWLFQELNDPKL